ncbi:TonB-dependent receptor domain-containing protein [Rheinheimera sp. UJ63]|uniref:TonB-dependent receptor domain-containing protein n=1 Tax=Rheinheimera sp. UJ63 TaxID=2910157 RepID=UPI001F218B73|nr:TonB-dependent receptor [Rheinheimera sp. UJ63]MCF4009391.1 TonB-dependent receptor [Rheinheimera sp. UJ63]
MSKMTPATLLLLSLSVHGISYAAQTAAVTAEHNARQQPQSVKPKAHPETALDQHPDEHDDEHDDSHAAEHADEHQDSHASEHAAEHEHADSDTDEHDHHEHIEKIVVQATRSGRIADEQPIRVELINREEIEEKAAMRPGNISMLVAETGGVRVQTTSPALGSANIRLQGLYGRYTQLLADGLPLYGNQASSIGLLQIPPTDLKRVEIIKGSASSLYGGSAMGGVINLVSRTPGDTRQGEVLLNATSRDGQDITSYIETPLTARLQGSITAGAHHQASTDVDQDGWIDLAGYERYTARPRLYWQGEQGATLYGTLGVMSEKRQGGTMPGSSVSDGNPFNQSQDSERLDGGVVFNLPVFDNLNLNSRGSVMQQQHLHRFGVVLEEDQHESYLLESSLAGYTANSDWVIGAAYQAEQFTSQTFQQFDYHYRVPGLFSQFDYAFNALMSTSLSARLENHSEFGQQFSPRVSLLYRPGDLTVRASYGRGYFAPTPFVEEIDAAGLSRLETIDNLQAETAQTASLDVTYSHENIESSITLFAANIDDAIGLAPIATGNDGVFNGVRLVNNTGASKIRGSELLLRYYWQDIKLTASYLYLDATELAADTLQQREIALTPKHSAGFVAMWEQHGRFRAGFEAYYTGVQRLNDNPFTDYSTPYWHLGLMGEITVGQFSWFVNLENLLDVKQTDQHPMILPNRAASGQWTTDIWSRNDGFIVNAGVRVKFNG